MKTKEVRGSLSNKETVNKLKKLETSKENLIKVLVSYLNENATQYSFGRKALGYCRARDFPRLYQLADEVSTVVYDTVAEHYAANQFGALVLKYPLPHHVFGLTMAPRAKAVDKFNASETKCARTNRRFRNWYKRRSSFHPMVEKMRQFIYHVLGEEPGVGWIDKCGFGPGSAIGVSGNATNYARKVFAESWTVTPTAVPFFISAIKHNFHIKEGLCQKQGSMVCYDMQHIHSQIVKRLERVTFNKIAFVSKTAATDRTIAVEPLCNNFVQTGAGELIVHLLRRVGCYLDDQTWNSYLAQLGSIFDDLCTIDLSSASDTIAIELCRILLPPKWFAFLNCIRSPSYKLPGHKDPVRYEKFTSMGNGFCFPLETLIFLAAVNVFEEDRTKRAVYGDDIILPSVHYDGVTKLLKFCGFTPNMAKSYAKGAFRESCGADWYKGLDVRPVYLDHLLLSNAEVMVFHNATLRSQRVQDAFTGVRAYLRELTPPEDRYLRPQSMNQWTKAKWGISREEVYNMNGAFTVPDDLYMCSRWAVWNKATRSWGWREFRFSPVLDKVAMTSDTARYWAFLRGSIGGEIHLRRETSLSSVKIGLRTRYP